MKGFQKIIEVWRDINGLPPRTQTILTLGLAIMIFSVGSINHFKLWSSHRWTVATTISKEDHGYVRYTFKVNGVIFESRKRNIGLESDSVRYWVKFYTKDPSICDILHNDEVPECIGMIPDNGWGEIPNCNPSVR